MKILFLGDMVGRPARQAVVKFIAENKTRMNIDAVIVNSDNLAHGRGVTRKTVEEMLGAGVDFLTCGDHAWDNPQASDIMKADDLKFLCPCNLSNIDDRLSGKTFEINGIKILVVNLMGTVFMEKEIAPPFEVADKLIEENAKSENPAKIIILDFHAEATSEKKAIGRYLDGRVSAVLGTHTHVQTADETVLPGGTAYITDAGMVGIEKSILGCEIDSVLEQFINKTPFKYKLAEEGDVMLEGVIIDVDENTGKAIEIERLRERVEI